MHVLWKVPRWISFGKRVGSQCSNSSAHENRKTAGQTIRTGPSSLKQLATEIACKIFDEHIKILKNSANSNIMQLNSVSNTINTAMSYEHG